jgi:signal transduction histidine kinase
MSSSVLRMAATTGPPVLWTVAVAVLGAALVFVVGTALWARARGRAHLRETTRQLAAERARRQRLESRVRIVSEMHDIAAGHVSRIAVQASTAEFRIGVLPPALRLEYEAFGAAARESLVELGRLLDVLRDDDEVARAPRPGLSDVPGLVEAARSTGTPVRLVSAKMAAEVPPLVGLTAYRIVQEALANSARHSAGAAATVALMLDAPRDGEAQLVVSVTNDTAPGRPDVTPSVRHEGSCTHGLQDLRERVTLLGGELEVGQRGDGFAVRATLPLTRVRTVDPRAPA